MYAISLRIIVSVLLGFALGLEREITNKYAGLRTHILVCLGACVFTLLSLYGFPTFAHGDNVSIDTATGVRDTARVAAQIVTGIGFIGAGTVLRNGSSVHGLTTAATLWMAASIGMACGAGRFDIAVISTLVSVCVLILIKVFEKNILNNKKLFKKLLRITINCSGEDCDNIHKFITKNFNELKEISKFKNDCGESKIEALILIKNNNPIQNLYKKFEQFNLKSISIQEHDD